MIFEYRTTITERSQAYGGGSYTQYALQDFSTFCCDQMAEAINEDYIHFDGLNKQLCVGAFTPVAFCPACGKAITLKEVGKVRRYCTTEKKMVEMEVENWHEENMPCEAP